MDILKDLVGHSNQVIEAFIWYRLMTNMLEKKHSKKIYLGAAGLIVVFLMIKGSIFSIPSIEHLRAFGTIAILIYTLLAGIFLFGNSFFEKLIWWGVYYLGLIIMELVTLSFLNLVLKVSFDEISSNSNINNWATIVTKLFTLLFFELLINGRKEKLQIKASTYRNLAILVAFNMILMVGCVVVFYNTENTNIDLNTIIQFFFGIVLVTLIVSFSLVFRIEKESKKEIQTKLKLQQIELELKQNNDMINITDNLRKLRHDMNNHIGLIKNLVYTQHYDELKQYVDQLYGDVELANEFVISDNKTLAVLLNAKKNKAKELNIEFQSIIATAEMNMQDKDICVLLGNILDNAIEAANKASNKKYIDFSIQKSEAGCVILCENSFGEKPVVKKGKFISNKENSFLHGIGTENMKDIVAKYKGEIHFDFDEDAFHVQVVMPV